jgi:hypothetical protein
VPVRATGQNNLPERPCHSDFVRATLSERTCQSNLVRVTCLCNVDRAELCSIGIFYSHMGHAIEVDESMSQSCCSLLCGMGIGLTNQFH